MKYIYKTYILLYIMSINIEYNGKEINNVICLNILKMLNRRNLINDIVKTFNEILEDINKKAIIEFQLNNNTKCNIYFINAKLTSISQGTPIDEYLLSNLETHKIIVLKDAAKKVLKQILTEYKNTEFFFEHEMLEDIPSKIFIPEHRLINDE